MKKRCARQAKLGGKIDKAIGARVDLKLAQTTEKLKKARALVDQLRAQLAELEERKRGEE